MPEKQIDCIRVKSRARQKRSWLLWLGDVVFSTLDAALNALAIAVTGCLAGIGFGAGLALVVALM